MFDVFEGFAQLSGLTQQIRRHNQHLFGRKNQARGSQRANTNWKQRRSSETAAKHVSTALTGGQQAKGDGEFTNRTTRTRNSQQHCTTHAFAVHLSDEGEEGELRRRRHFVHFLLIAAIQAIQAIQANKTRVRDAAKHPFKSAGRSADTCRTASKGATRTLAPHYGAISAAHPITQIEPL